MKINKFIILVGMLFLVKLGLAQNQIKNPGFEVSNVGWNFWGGILQKEVIRSGTSALKVTLNTARWSGADQIIFFQEGVKKVEVSGWMKTENVVKGALDYEQARISVEFYDNNGSLVGGYPPVTGQKIGTSDWIQYSHTYMVPQGAKQVKIQTVLGNCTGTAYFDDIEVLLFGENGISAEAATKVGPMDEGKWYPVELNTKNTGSHYVDWSSLLDAPAGKHGFAKEVNGHIQFSDGTPVRFWGTNLVANNAFPSKQQADSVAQRLAKMGCNLIRLHHMDAPWSTPNIFGNGSSTEQLSSASLDKLDYLTAALKKKGIYIYLDLLVHRDFTAAEGVVNKPPDLGGKQVAYFDKRMIELQKEYIRELLMHKNPYTGNTYKDEPAIIGSEFINESSAFLHFGGDILTDPYRKELQKQFEEAGNTGKKLSVFDLDYSSGVSPKVTIRKGTIGDNEASLRFISKIEQNYYNDMKSFMRSLGVKYMLSGSNFPIPVLAYQFDNFKVNDLIITNDYWDHPQLWKLNNDWNRILYAPINNTSMIKDPAKSPINNIVKYKWKDKPFLVTEYNACYPNEYILEGIPFIAAYSRLQDVDGILQFDFTLNALGEEALGPFSLSKMQDHLAQWVMGAPIFLRGDIVPAKGLVLDNISDKQLYSLPNYSDFSDKNYQLSYITKVAKTYGDAKVDSLSKYATFFDVKNNIIKSETGQLKLDANNGTMEINSEKIQGAVGALKDVAIDLPFLSFKVKNSWASIFLISKENKPLSEAKRFYLVAVTPVKMTGQTYNPGRSALIEPGKLPLQAQQLEGDLILKVKSAKIKIVSLMADGTKGKSINFEGKENGWVFKLSEGRAFVYEIEIE